MRQAESTHKPVTTASKRLTSKGSLTSRELAFIGIGGIIGAGYFLGVGLPIRTAGPAVLLSFVLGAFIVAQVVGSLASMAVNEPVEGSFKVYADEYMGSFAGYIQGWVYYVSSVLTISSEAVASAIFTKLWLPHIPLWAMSGTYAFFVLLVNAFGIKNFGRVESAMSAVKISALIGFIIFAVFVLFAGGFNAVKVHSQPWGINQLVHQPFFPHGFSGFLQSMLIVIFAYAGIGVFGTAAGQAKNGKMIDRAAVWTVGSLLILYLASVFLVLALEPWFTLNTSTSPFVVVLERSGIPVLATVFNGVILIASFSVMAGSVFSANEILRSLSADREAPQVANRENARGTSTGALWITAGATALALVVSNILPSNVYNFLISASSFFTFLNWFLILWTFLRWRKVQLDSPFMSVLSFGKPFTTYVTMLLIVVLAGYALIQHDQRIGFYGFLTVMVILGLFYVLFRKQMISASPAKSR